MNVKTIITPKLNYYQHGEAIQRFLREANKPIQMNTILAGDMIVTYIVYK